MMTIKALPHMNDATNTNQQAYHKDNK
jgi:hypothetical protein